MASRTLTQSDVAPGSLVVVPLPNGTYSVIWILEADSLDASRYFQFLIMAGFLPAPPNEEDSRNLRLAEDREGPRYRLLLDDHAFRRVDGDALKIDLISELARGHHRERVAQVDAKWRELRARPELRP